MVDTRPSSWGVIDAPKDLDAMIHAVVFLLNISAKASNAQVSQAFSTSCSSNQASKWDSQILELVMFKLRLLFSYWTIGI